MQAILLCGGLGTRLRSVVSDRPKPLADICGRAFMAYVTDALVRQGITDIIFAAGYRGEMIEEYFGDGSRFGFSAQYAYETEPLGTGGAIRNALPYVREEQVFVLNADTYYEIEYLALKRLCEEQGLAMALVTREVTDISRFGEVKSEGGCVTSWNEKSEDHRPGEINGGIYLLSREFIEELPEGRSSFEQEVIPRWLSEGRRIGSLRFEGYFIDIGVPESYQQFIDDVTQGRIGKEENIGL